MERDLKEVVGVLMSALDGGRVSRAEVEDLQFEGDGELLAALNDAFIKLLELAFDQEAEPSGYTLDNQMRAELQKSLDVIVRLSTRTPNI